ncbi:S-adenosyl-L-methionine-dependent methyltransferase superfamily protein [Forsythia ovata]|uniref:S-adenosyl-L-methionine-dependent methyltransferase superfamily protein n=1 Tax=Forsythia ovata TaxID=205694 RepID=A0ABD1TAD5_9LAMI
MPSQFYAMNGGNGSQSYVKNSPYQRGIVEAAKEIIKEGISKNLDIEKLSLISINTFRIADFGCSTGPNTFVAMQTIVEAISKKFETNLSNSHIPEFQVFFNDQTSNDFNILFASLPPQRQYYAAGVPGSFYDRRFPKASLHFAYSSCTLNWLSEIPKEVMDNLSPAWNKGKILYYGDKRGSVQCLCTSVCKGLWTHS